MIEIKDLDINDRFLLPGEKMPHVWQIAYREEGESSVLCKNINPRWPCGHARFSLDTKVDKLSHFAVEAICRTDETTEVVNDIVPPFGFRSGKDTLVQRTRILSGQHHNGQEACGLIAHIAAAQLRGVHPKYALKQYVDEMVRDALREAVETDEYLSQHLDVLADTLDDVSLKNLITRTLIDMRISMGDDRTIAAKSILKDTVERLEQAGNSPMDQLHLLLCNIGPEAVAHIVYGVGKHALTEREQELVYNAVYDRFVVKQNDSWKAAYYAYRDMLVAGEK